MPYSSTDELPDNVAHVLPQHAQEIFVAAFNSAYDEYDKPSERRGDDSREDVARKVAWSAVKTKYEKGADDKWHLKEAKGH